MNKLQNSIMTRKMGNPAVILEVDNIIKTDITEQIVVILIGSRSPGFKMNQNQVEKTHWVEEETNYCNSLTDVFPLNY